MSRTKWVEAVAASLDVKGLEQLYTEMYDVARKNIEVIYDWIGCVAMNRAKRLLSIRILDTPSRRLLCSAMAGRMSASVVVTHYELARQVDNRVERLLLLTRDAYNSLCESGDRYAVLKLALDNYPYTVHYGFDDALILAILLDNAEEAMIYTVKIPATLSMDVVASSEKEAKSLAMEEARGVYESEHTLDLQWGQATVSKRDRASLEDGEGEEC